MALTEWWVYRVIWMREGPLARFTGGEGMAELTTRWQCSDAPELPGFYLAQKDTWASHCPGYLNLGERIFLFLANL